MADAEQRLVAPHRANRSADLIGEVANASSLYAVAKRAADRIARTILMLMVEENFDRFLESAGEQVIVAVEWHEPVRTFGQAIGNVKSVQGEEKKMPGRAGYKLELVRL